LDVDGILMVIFKWEYGDLMGYLWDIYIYIYVIFNVVLMGSSWMFFGLCHVILTLTILLDFNGILLYYHGRSCFMVKIMG
jgi:hypothetical protein